MLESITEKVPDKSAKKGARQERRVPVKRKRVPERFMKVHITSLSSSQSLHSSPQIVFVSIIWSRIFLRACFGVCVKVYFYLCIILFVCVYRWIMSRGSQ